MSFKQQPICLDFFCKGKACNFYINMFFLSKFVAKCRKCVVERYKHLLYNNKLYLSNYLQAKCSCLFAILEMGGNSSKHDERNLYTRYKKCLSAFKKNKGNISKHSVL